MVINPIKYFIVILLSIAVALCLLYFGYIWATYIDHTVTTGDAYGFSIGDNKRQTYNKAPNALLKLTGHASPIYIEIRVTPEISTILATKPDYDVLTQSYLHDVGYVDFLPKDRWVFYIDGSYFNKLSLRFCENRLCEIHRHRKYFEGP